MKPLTPAGLGLADGIATWLLQRQDELLPFFEGRDIPHSYRERGLHVTHDTLVDSSGRWVETLISGANSADARQVPERDLLGETGGALAAELDPINPELLAAMRPFGEPTAKGLLATTLRTYLESIESLATSDKAKAERVGRELVAACRDDALDLVTFIPCTVFPLDLDELRAGVLSVHRLSPLESGLHATGLRQSGRLVRDLDTIAGSPLTMDGFTPTHGALAMVRGTGEDYRLSTEFVQAEALLLAFELSDVPLEGPGTSTRWANPRWLLSSRAGRRTPQREIRIGHPLGIDATKLAAISDLVMSLRRFDITFPRNQADVALHRCLTAAAQETTQRADAVIDYAIAAEAALLNGNSQELSMRICLMAANLIGDSDKDRRDVFSTLRKMYARRSKIVHGVAGDERGRADSLDNVLQTAPAVVRRLLSKCVREGFPTKQDATRILLRQPPE